MKINKLLLYFNLFFLQAYLLRFKLGTYSTNLQEILIGLQILTFIYSIVQQKIFSQTIKNIKRHRIILSLIILTGLSIILVPIENKIDFFRQLKFLFFACLLTFIFIETFKNNEERKQAFKIAGIGAMVFGLFCVVYNLLGYNIANDHRLLGPLNAAVYLGYYLTPFFIFFTIETLENKKKSDLLYSIALGVLILATMSMGSIAGSFIIILLYLFKRNGPQIFQNKKTTITIFLTFMAVTGTVFYLKILPTIQTNYSSLSERGQIWQTSFSLLQKPQIAFFGAGYGQFQEQYAENVKAVLGHEPLDYYVLQPHNIFLLFIFQYGIAGLIFLIFCIMKNLKNISKFSKNQSLNFQTLANFILLYFFIHGLIDTPFFKNDLLILLILMLESSLIQARSQTLQN